MHGGTVKHETSMMTRMQFVTRLTITSLMPRMQTRLAPPENQPKQAKHCEVTLQVAELPKSLQRIASDTSARPNLPPTPL